VRNSSHEQSSEQTLYVRSDRSRTEYRNSMGRAVGPRLASIRRCDLKEAYELNLDSGEYVSAPYSPEPLSKEQMEALGLKRPEFSVSATPTLRVETATLDTGERKAIFGHTARHVITQEGNPAGGSQREA
jgi:hypothetical protein